MCFHARRRRRLALPAGEVLAGEHWLLHASLRIPLLTARFPIQRVHPFASSGGGVYEWAEGDRYTGSRPHADVALVSGDPDVMLERLERAGQTELARLLTAATRSYRTMSEATYFADNPRLLDPAYMRSTSVEVGSGFGGGPAEWRLACQPIVGAITRDGSFLDAGCANGLLMESVHLVRRARAERRAVWHRYRAAAGGAGPPPAAAMGGITSGWAMRSTGCRPTATASPVCTRSSNVSHQLRGRR